MLYWTATFFVVSLVCALFAFTGIAPGAAGIATVLFFVSIVLFVVTLIAYALRHGP